MPESKDSPTPKLTRPQLLQFLAILATGSFGDCGMFESGQQEDTPDRAPEIDPSNQ